MCLAFAEMLLSIRSANADSSEYPIERIDSSNDGACGGFSISFIFDKPRIEI